MLRVLDEEHVELRQALLLLWAQVLHLCKPYVSQQPRAAPSNNIAWRLVIPHIVRGRLCRAALSATVEMPLEQAGRDIHKQPGSRLGLQALLLLHDLWLALLQARPALLQSSTPFKPASCQLILQRMQLQLHNRVYFTGIGLSTKLPLLANLLQGCKQQQMGQAVC